MPAKQKPDPLRRAVLGCGSAVFLAPLAGLVAWQVAGFTAALVTWGLSALALVAWSAVNLWRVPTGTGSIPRWYRVILACV